MNEPPPRLDHAGLSVADLDLMATWYGDVFDFQREITLRVEPIELDIVMLIHPEYPPRGRR